MFKVGDDVVLNGETLAIVSKVRWEQMVTVTRTGPQYEVETESGARVYGADEDELERADLCTVCERVAVLAASPCGVCRHKASIAGCAPEDLCRTCLEVPGRETDHGSSQCLYCELSAVGA